MRVRTFYFALAVFLAIAIAGCSEGYRLDPATIDINDVTEESKVKLLEAVSQSLTAEGFAYLGRFDQKIALIGQDHVSSPAEKEKELARLNRERTFLNEARHMRVVWADFSNGTSSSNHFVELDIYEERPGGFSPEGLAFYNRFLTNLQQDFGTAVKIVKPPPPTDAAEYRRITRSNRDGAVFGWFVAASAALLVTGSISVFILKRLNLSTTVRRLIFTLVNAWLIAPLPFQGGFIFVFPGPNLFAFPWTDLLYYEHVASYALLSFPSALTLCALVSLFLFKNRPLVPA